MIKNKIIFEDEAFLVINKPCGLVVNNSTTSPGDTLQKFVFEYIGISEDGSEFASRGGIVHRLDKGTSGVLLVAKTPEAFENLKSQFQERTVEKKYYAVVLGKVPDDIIEINAPIARNPKSRMRFAVVEDGREAHTFVRKIKTIQDYTVLDVSPKTGRTHQIRVHLAALGFPVVADPSYCSRAQYKRLAPVFGRMMLHAYFLSFLHPLTGKKMDFTSLPEEEIWNSFIS